MNLSVDSGKARRLSDWVLNARGTICIVTHRNADPDAIASAIALQYLIKKLRPDLKVEVLLPEGIELASKRVLEELNIGYDILGKAGQHVCESAVVVDASTSDQLGEYANVVKGGNYVVIDHHEVNELTGSESSACITIHSSKSSSTSELIAEVLMELKLKPPNTILTLLITGILYDTRMLRLATPETFYVMAWLTLNGGDYRKAIKILTSKEVSKSEIIARLKGVSRTGIYKVGDRYLMAVTCIGAFESSVLKLLIDAGADIAIAMAKRKGLTRLIIRASHKVIKDLGSPLASEIAQHIARELGGSGGGHAGAAGVVINKSVDPEAVLNAIKSFFKSEGLSVNTLEEGRWVEECD